MKKGIQVISSSVTECFRIQTDQKTGLKHNLGHFCLTASVRKTPIHSLIFTKEHLLALNWQSDLATNISSEKNKLVQQSEKS